MNAYAEDPLVEQLAIGRLVPTLFLFESLPAQQRNCMFCLHFLFEWKTSE